MSDIVVGYDGSDCGKSALEVAVGLAKELGDRVVVTYSYDIDRLGGEVQDMAAVLEQRGQKLVDEAKSIVQAQGLEVDAELVPDRPADALSSMAEQRKARVIVVGTYGDSPLKGAILGSTPHKLLHISKTPVLVVPAG